MNNVLRKLNPDTLVLWAGAAFIVGTIGFILFFMVILAGQLLGIWDLDG